MNASAKPSLWQNLLSLRQMDQAWAKVRANNGCAGGDNVSIAAFSPGALRRIAELADKLRRGKYRPGPYRQVAISKKNGGKRILMIPSIEDRILHTALAQVLSPVLEPQFEDSSYAYRPGRSVQQAVAAIGRWRKAGFWHVIEADIVGYFDNIRHDLLLRKLEIALRGEAGAVEIIDLVALTLAQLSQETGVLGRAVAQGSPLSPLLANLYLDALDEAMAGRGVRLIRFADDFVVLCKKRRDAETALRDVVEVLAEHGLEMHPGGTRVVDFERGFEFLGHMFVRSFTLAQISDPDEDPLVIMRELAKVDATGAANQATKEHERKSGYDAGARVLYVMEPGRKVVLRNLSFVVQGREGREVVAISHNRVDRIEIGPAASADPAVYEHCLATETDLALVNGFGELRGTLRAPVAGRADLHLEQARAVLAASSQTQLARALVDARIRNQRTQLFRLNRRQDNPDVTRALAAMGRHLRKLDQLDTVDGLRGIEGAVGAEYWPALGLLVKDAPTPFRRQRPARGGLNACVNYLTAMLARDVNTAVLAAGLHPGFGALHVARDRGDACVYDMMEPFRAPLSEGLAAFLFNSSRLRAEMFTPLPDKSVRLSRDAVSAIIKGYEQAVARRVNITGRKGKLAWRPMMRRQAVDLARALRAQDMTLFTPYLMQA
ncbi:MAG: CRISPR-associated endonuclease Cas1 [Alphaproteobacteria bacterium]|nr:CRISPR-associated endonuclease Cas1 [Alphaproteobacteria bacterium]